MASLPFPIPDSLPFSVCYPTTDLKEACIQTGGIVDQYGQPRDCSSAPGGSTPPLVSADITYTEKTIVIGGDAEITFERSVWVGIETDLDGFWVGEETSEQCARYDLNGLSPASTAQDIIDEAEDAADRATRNIVGVDPTTALGSVIAFGILVLIILLFDGIPVPY
jgi:hypothetical protein